MFDVLPPELIDVIFDYVLPHDSFSIEIQSTANYVTSEDHPEDSVSCASLRRDPQYARYRGKQHVATGPCKWPDDVEDAFFQGTLGSSPCIPRSDKPCEGIYWLHTCRLRIERQPHSNEIISAMILELTGVYRNRKQVSSHVQSLKRVYSNAAKTSEQSRRPRVGPMELPHIPHLKVIDAGTFKRYELELSSTSIYESLFRSPQYM